MPPQFLDHPDIAVGFGKIHRMEIPVEDCTARSGGSGLTIIGGHDAKRKVEVVRAWGRLLSPGSKLGPVRHPVPRTFEVEARRVAPWLSPSFVAKPSLRTE